MGLKTEDYKGYHVKFVEKVLGRNKFVVGEFSSKITGKLLGVEGVTKQMALTKIKKIINKEVKAKGLN